ncbi:hypothetical protein GW17_00027266 [Ensete ventricosum]|uniref:Uncharacterized protein n=1 Tax=Ensete ventricosum TaxID=4639 RepID=A0A444EFW2_ENSVE|nr:hypothetical protein B296_00005719 [Ensete ventricosum]RWW09253.1 hypothetical protein GW17_00027266 [Ensete ventricosum]
MGSLLDDWPSYDPHNFSQLRPADSSAQSSVCFSDPSSFAISLIFNQCFHDRCRNLRLSHIVQLITRLSHHQIKVTMLSLFRPKRAASDHLTPEHSCKQPRYAYADEADVF